MSDAIEALDHAAAALEAGADRFVVAGHVAHARAAMRAAIVGHQGYKADLDVIARASRRMARELDRIEASQEAAAVSPWDLFQPGDLVTRPGAGIRRVISASGRGGLVETECVRATGSCSCRSGHRELNLAHRYEYLGPANAGETARCA